MVLFKYRRCPVCDAPISIATVLRSGIKEKLERGIKCESCRHTISRVYETDKFGFAFSFLVLALGGLLTKIFGVESVTTILLVAASTPVILVVAFYNFLPFTDHGE